MFKYICVYTELMTISIPLVAVTMMDLWTNKKMMIRLWQGICAPLL